jgi:NAD(P)-dependent dehydrogenase (short-subunit alcohol dehydrogenase family)
MTALLEGKVAVVTGAAHGIGRGHALELAKHGARVVVNDRGVSVRGEGSGQDADLTVDLIRGRGGDAIANYGDIAEEADVDALFAQAIAEYDKVDILVNNAGIARDSAIWNMSPDDYDAVMRVHVRGTWMPSRAAARHWRERFATEGRVGGRIINTTSGAGLVGNFGQTNYAAAKAAIAGLTLTTSLELHKFGVTVNAIGPGGATRIVATMPNAPKLLEPDDLGADEYNPMDPAGSSPLVAWLASDEAGHVTGQVIRAVHDRIILMDGWSELREVTSGQKRWDANTLGQVLATDLFRTRSPGLR